MKYQLKQALFILVVVMLSACNGGSERDLVENTEQGDDTQDTIEDSIMELEVLSPSYSQATTSRAVKVTGKASDSQHSIRSVTVNGIEANSDDGFSSWVVDLPLEKTITKLSIELENSHGQTESFTHGIHLSPISELFSEPSSLSIDVSQDKLLILDALQKTLFASDTANPDLGRLPLKDSDAQLNAPQKIIYDPNSERMLVLDQRKTRPVSQAIISISSEDQTAQVLKDGLDSVLDIAVGEGQDLIYFLSTAKYVRNGGRLHAYDPVTDSVSVISYEANAGPAIYAPSNLVVTKGRAYYIDLASDQIVSINLKTGNRIVISSADSSFPLQGIVSVVTDENGSVIWGADEQGRRLIRIDTSSGDRTLVSGDDQGDGVNFKAPNSLVYDEKNERLLVGDSGLNQVLTVDLVSGDRRYFINNRYGDGPLFDSPVSIDVISNELAYVLDVSQRSIFKVNLRNGDREQVMISSNDMTQASTAGFSVDAENEIAWILDKNSANIIKVDLSAAIDDSDRTNRVARYRSQSNAPDFKLPVSFDRIGNEFYVSDIYYDLVFKSHGGSGATEAVLHSETEAGQRLQKVVAVDLDEEGERLVGIDQVLKSVFISNLQSKKSLIISSSGRGSGIDLESPADIQLGASNEAYVLDAGLNAIIRINLNNGNRSVLSNRAVGDGPVFKALSSLSYDRASNTLFAVDKGEKAVFSIDVSSGDRTILSR